MLYSSGIPLAAHGEPTGKVRLQFQIKSPPEGVQLTRLDLLLSRLALQRSDGSWMESNDWFAFVSQQQNRLTSDSDGVPDGNYKAVRFNVGLPEETNRANPAQWPPNHPLHPELNGMHWGWLGGYVFAAIEGKVADQGFSYHLAGKEIIQTVELPVTFKGGGPVTILIEIDPNVWLQGLDLKTTPNSTHSRPGDSLAPAIAEKFGSVFKVRGIHSDLFQQPARSTPQSVPAGTTPYRLTITERFSSPALPADNPLTKEGVALGKRLFHDKILSGKQTQSCASCHMESRAFSHDVATSLGGEGQKGVRNAMPIFNLAWHKAFFWDGRAKTLRDQVLMPIQDKNEMNASLDLVLQRLNGDSSYPALFRKSFGSDQITSASLAKALEQYLLSIVSQDSKFDRAVRKQAELTAEERLGLQLFITEHDPERGLRGADCFHCHGGTLFTNHGITNNGLKELSPRDRGKFKTPSLRNIALTAPYMHDGRFTTLEEVIEHYSSGVQRNPDLDPNLAKHPATGIQLNAEEKKALVSFLRTLTDDQLLHPTDLTVANQP
ncbi:MAG: cytochrome C peroxidase [Verrucomicrobiaceae bacterium]|nr:cytochrome C peroxidase [Verrucomicrobiaceae bacterium]